MNRMRTLLLAMLLAVGSVLVPAATADAPYTPPATIDRTGLTDVTQPLLDFVAGVPDGATISLPAGARYRVEGSIDIAYRHGLTIEGNGARIFATTPGDRTRRHVRVLGGSDIVIRNLVVEGANPFAGVGEAAYHRDREAQHAFEFIGVDGAELDRVRASDVYGDFVYVGKDNSTQQWGRNIWVHHSVFERNGRQGVAVTAGEHVLIEHNVIAEVRRATFDLEPNTARGGAIDITVRNNQIGRGRLLFLAAVGQAGRVEDVRVVGNTLTGKAMNVNVVAPDGSRRARILIADNVSDRKFGSMTGRLMEFQGIDGLTVTNNYQQMQAGRDMVGVRVSNSCDVVVAGNAFPDGRAESDITPGACGLPGEVPPPEPDPDPTPTPNDPPNDPAPNEPAPSGPTSSGGTASGGVQSGETSSASTTSTTVCRSSFRC